MLSCLWHDCLAQEYKSVASETLEELEWCLKQLETIQTKRPVSDMAFSKFKRLLNKELNSFGEADKSRHEISAYICGTFLEDEKDAEANQEIEQMLERRRSSGQSHTSIGTAHDSQVYVTGGRSQSQQQQQQLQSNRTTEKGGDRDVTSAEAGSASVQPECGSVEDGGTNLSHTGKTMIGNASSENLSSEAQADLPMHGIATSNDQELNDRFTQYLDTWGIDIFEVDRLSDGHGLVTTTYRIFQIISFFSNSTDFRFLLQQRDLMRIFK
ncbi:Phosphodiesterase [Fasciola gigantica]|uniref:3',5'-cyclic-AMP phosphodiesterase n=1 Tax=Fasciola gigantica TaxID=46835 RepID=A0A504YBE6_FASGI|nr:Phosphodiesterase [Fasciola gigantica]